MKKILSSVIVLGLSAFLQAGTVSCKFPVVKCEPIWKTVIKKIPRQECWDEVITNGIKYKDSGVGSCTTGGIVVAKKCVVTKCKTVYDSCEEKVLVGYKNTAKCGCAEFSKISNKKLKFITAQINY